MNTSQTTVFYKTESNSVGFRPNIFDWQEGDKIRTADGEPCTIIRVVDTTVWNLKVLNMIINTLNKFPKVVYKKSFIGSIPVGVKSIERSEAERYVNKMLEQIK
jgi:hypothetical protein